MRPAPVHAVALLLVVAAVSAPIAGAAPQDDQLSQFDDPSPLIATVDGFANYLTIPPDEVESASYSGVDVDVGNAIASDVTALRSDHETATFEREFASADSADRRTQLIRDRTEAIEQRRDELQERQQTLIEDYARDSISTGTFLGRMALIDAEARRLAEAVTSIQDTARTTSYSLPSALDTRLDTVRGELEVLSGPVGERASASMSGAQSIDAVYVESSETGYALAMVDGDDYVRETYLGDERRPEATDQFRESDLYVVNAVNRRWVTLYPWVANETFLSGQGLGDTGIYRFRADYTSGAMTAYFDGGTTNVFRESHRQSVSQVPTSSTASAENASLRLAVNRTYETGPMKVSVSRSTTDVPVDATVSVNGQRVGTTGQDGTVWLVEPRPGVRVTAETDDGDSVSIRLSS